MITEKGLSKLLKKYLMELEPVAKDEPKTTEVKMVTGSSGAQEVQVVQERADRYMDEQFAKSLSMAIAKAIHPHLKE